MRILAVADEESKLLWDHFKPEYLKDIDLVISCGDLKASYLSFLATFSRAPILYVHGNHDSGYEQKPPEGCVCIEDTVYVHKGLRLAGLGGSMRYKPGPHQYDEREMARRAARMEQRIRRVGGLDVLVTHAPARGASDGDDLPHRGFECFNRLIKAWQPQVFVHGHVHLNYGAFPREYEHFGVRVINAYERHRFEVEPMEWQRPRGLLALLAKKGGRQV